ncbi:MAG TPA: FCD domain-containing protein [Acidimicrobiia bacterium]|nr:FCD domain-containing protein [Acidimicrobiia bacterium]
MTTQRTRATPPHAEEIAAEVRGRIHRGALGPGDRLPPERELAGQLGVSRDRLRDALGVLERDGYLVRKRGATGGRFVSELAAPFASWATRTEHDLDDIVDYRLAVECQAARFAAERRTRADLAALGDAVERLAAADSPRDYRLADVAFHAAIAFASRNQRLATAVERARGELFEPADVLWRDGRNDSLADHRRILAAIDAGDPDAAAGAVAEHIERTRHELRALVRAAAGPAGGP